MNIVEETSVPAEALPLQAFREHLRLGSGFSDDSLQDALLESTLRAAIGAIEYRTGKALFRRTFVLRLEEWAKGTFQPIMRGPLVQVDEVRIVTSGGSVTPVAASTYKVVPDNFRAGIEALQTLPTVPANAHIEITFQAGYGANWQDVPESLAQATMVLGAHFYETRGGAPDTGLPMLVRVLIEAFRDLRLFGGRKR
ncbi:head-tail connector protein [Tropicimonas sp. S265A]|uniref:head-tail connector protein n=1 Tax=Tropicimonas sp. S265A TaxID=3415134 RepID=UPI003C7E2F49